MDKENSEKIAEELMNLLFDFQLNMISMTKKFHKMSNKEHNYMLKTLEVLVKKTGRWQEIDLDKRSELAKMFLGFIAKWKAETEIEE